MEIAVGGRFRLSRIRSLVRVRARRELALLVVDHLQLLDGGGKLATRKLEVAALSKGLRLWAGELAVLVLSQVTVSNHVVGRLAPLGLLGLLLTHWSLFFGWACSKCTEKRKQLAGRLFYGRRSHMRVILCGIGSPVEVHTLVWLSQCRRHGIVNFQLCGVQKDRSFYPNHHGVDFQSVGACQKCIIRSISRKEKMMVADDAPLADVEAAAP